MRLRLVLETGKTSGWLEEEKWREGWKKSFGLEETEQAMVAGWLHLFLWGMSDADRARILSVVLQRPIMEEQIKPRELALKAWEDFPEIYKRAPIRLEEET
jgi:hypothetical protein